MIKPWTGTCIQEKEPKKSNARKKDDKYKIAQKSLSKDSNLWTSDSKSFVFIFMVTSILIPGHLSLYGIALSQRIGCQVPASLLVRRLALASLRIQMPETINNSYAFCRLDINEIMNGYLEDLKS